MYVCLTLIYIPITFDATQWVLRWVGADDRAYRESYIETYQHNPDNHANSCNIKTNEAI